MINEAVKKIREFQKKAGQYVSDDPKQIPSALVERRVKWISEELNELLYANNIYEQADAITDLIYYALGAYVEAGLNPDPLFEIIHKANMRKVEDSTLIVRGEDDRVLKPDHWVHPDEEIKKCIDSMKNQFHK